MRDDISTDLKNKLVINGATPIYYLIFHFATGDEYVSDRQMYTADGHLTNDLLSGVVNIRQSAALDEAVNNLLLPNTEIKITLKNTSLTGWFCSKINVNPIENTKVSLYLTSSDSVDSLLIDKYLIRDPIEYSEDSPFVDLTLVTSILAQNVTIGGIDPATNDYYPLVVGAAAEIIGSPYGDQKIAKITATINSGTTVIPTDRDLVTAGFPSSGDLSLGFGTCHYAGISSQSFTGVTGIDIEVPVNSYICALHNDITFAYGIGPVDIAEPLYVNGEIYEYDYTVYKNETTVKVVFPDSLPYRIQTLYENKHVNNNLSQSMYLDSSYYIATYDSYNITSDAVITYITKNTAAPWSSRVLFKKAISLDFQIPEGAVITSTNIYLKVSLGSYSGSQYVGKGYTVISGKLHGVEIYGKLNPSTVQSDYWRYVTWLYDKNNITKSNTVVNDPDQNYFQLEFTGFDFVSPLTQFGPFQTSEFFEFSMSVTYEQVKPGYPKKIYTVTTSLSIGSSSGSMNPSTLIQSVVKQQSPDTKIDSASFLNCYNWFETNNYSFAGTVDGGMYCLDLLKHLLFLSRSYLTFAGGYVKLHISQLPNSAESKIISTEDTRLPKSIKIKRQPVDDISNNITLRYDYNLTTELYDSVYNNFEQDSIEILGVHETTVDGWLIVNSEHAQNLTDYWLAEKSIPKTVFTIKETARMTGVEIGDSVIVKTDYSDIRFFTGTVIKLDKSPATKDNVTTYNLTLVGKLNPPPKIINLYDDAVNVVEVRWITAIDGNGLHSLAIKSDNTLWAWGWNAYGQLGDGTTTDRHSPVQVGSDTDWVECRGGYSFSAGLKSNGTLWTWGLNQYGELGDGTTTDRHSPVQVGSDTDWVNCNLGYRHSLGIKSDNTLWAWGLNQYGALGDGTTTDRHSPVQVGSDTDWADCRGGYRHSLGIKSDNTLWAWGWNVYGQLGDGTTTDRHSPVQVGSDTDWVNCSGGGVHNLAVKSDGTLWAWGRNVYGQLGDGTTTDRHSPVQIGSDTDWINCDAGYEYSLAIKSDNTLWAWGRNVYGQLGDGTTTDRHSPVQIGYGSLYRAGHIHCISTTNLNDLLTWGRNQYGQLGDGTTTDRHSPTVIDDQYRVLKESFKINDSSIDIVELMDAETSLGWSIAPWSILPWSDKAPTSGWSIDPWSTSGWSI